MGWSPPKNAKIFGHLVNEVVRKGTCMMCGACVASCPINVLYVGENEEPVIRGPCAACQVCYYACPRLELPLNEIEMGIFGRTRRPEEDTLGIYEEALSARASDEEIWRAGQDGGTTLALAKHALDIGLVDSFVVTNFAKTDSLFILDRDTPIKATPSIAAGETEVVDSGGSKYTHGGVLGGLTEAAARYPNARIGLVALPCELQGLQRLQTALQATVKFGGSGILGGRPVLSLGLFCSKVYVHDKLVNEFLVGKHGIDPKKVTRTVIKRGRFRIYAGADELINVPLKELGPYVSGPCKYCVDYGAELADISVGALGSPDGWTTVLVRTPMGRSLLNSAVRGRAVDTMPIDPLGKAFQQLIRHAEKKKRENNPYYLKRGVSEPIQIQALAS